MRVRILRRGRGRVDGISVDRFEPGFIYEVGTIIGNLLLAEGWAEPVDDQRPAMVIPMLDEKVPPAVLVVDDDPATRAMLATLLTLQGYAVHTAEDGAAGFKILREHPPKLILLDLKMPRMSGADFREHQQRLGGSLADIPVVIVSVTDGADAETERLHARGYIPKPINDSALLKVVREVCGEPSGAQTSSPPAF